MTSGLTSGQSDGLQTISLSESPTATKLAGTGAPDERLLYEEPRSFEVEEAQSQPGKHLFFTLLCRLVLFKARDGS